MLTLRNSNILTWYTNSTVHEQVLSFDKRAQKIMREDTKEEAYITYTNTSRSDPIEHRYKSAEGRRRLRELKHLWDPKGRFTHEFVQSGISE